MPYKINLFKLNYSIFLLITHYLIALAWVNARFSINSNYNYNSHGNYGIGYTYTVGQNGHAILNCIKHDFTNILIDEDPQKNEFIWNKLWWASHYGGRGGPTSMAISAVDIAIWDLKAKQLKTHEGKF